MSEKVVLTQEQAEAIEKYKGDIQRNHWQQRHNKIRTEVTLEKRLLDIKTYDFMQALENGYEVEPNFAKGDWVKSTFGKGIGKIIRIDSLGYHIDFGLIDDGDNIRHATEEEIAEEKKRRWWNKHGRDVWELQVGDVLQNKHTGRHNVITLDRIGNDGQYLFTGFHLREVPGLKNNYLVICFAEDRKDV